MCVHLQYFIYVEGNKIQCCSLNFSFPIDFDTHIHTLLLGGMEEVSRDAWQSLR